MCSKSFAPIRVLRCNLSTSIKKGGKSEVLYAHGMIYLLCDVKRKMFTEEAKQVLDAWIEFTTSVPYTNEVRYTHLLEGPISRERKEEFTRRLTLQDKKEQELRRVVYGEKRWR